MLKGRTVTCFIACREPFLRTLVYYRTSRPALTVHNKESLCTNSQLDERSRFLLPLVVSKFMALILAKDCVQCALSVSAKQAQLMDTRSIS